MNYNHNTFNSQLNDMANRKWYPFSPKESLQEISAMTAQITADKRLAGADFETIKKITNEYERLKHEMHYNAQIKMEVLNADVTKFLKQELSDLAISGTTLSAKNNRILKKLEKALDFEYDGKREHKHKNTRVGDGFFKNILKNKEQQEEDFRKITKIEEQNNYIDQFYIKTPKTEPVITFTNISNKNTEQISNEKTKNPVETNRQIEIINRFFSTEFEQNVLLQVLLNRFNPSYHLEINGIMEERTQTALSNFHNYIQNKSGTNLTSESTTKNLEILLIHLENNGHSLKNIIIESKNHIKELQTAKITTNNNFENTQSISEKEIKIYAKDPSEIPNETIKIFYTQRALNVIKNNISEIQAKILISKQHDLEITGKMDDRTIKAIETFQKYINHYKYHAPNEPLEVTGKLDKKTMQLLVTRLNLIDKSQSEEIIHKSIEDIK